MATVGTHECHTNGLPAKPSLKQLKNDRSEEMNPESTGTRTTTFRARSRAWPWLFFLLTISFLISCANATTAQESFWTHINKASNLGVEPVFERHADVHKFFRINKNQMETTIHLRRTLRVGNLNVRGMTEGRIKLILAVFRKFKLDVLVLTETKRWSKSDTNETLKNNLWMIDASHESRGGVVVIGNPDAATAEPIMIMEGCMAHVEVCFNNGKAVQVVQLVATYINPGPTPEEASNAEIWEMRVRRLINDTTHPLIIIGDANRPGKDKLKKIGDDLLEDHIKSTITWKSGKN